MIIDLYIFTFYNKFDRLTALNTLVLVSFGCVSTLTKILFSFGPLGKNKCKTADDIQREKVVKCRHNRTLCHVIDFDKKKHTSVHRQ